MPKKNQNGERKASKKTAKRLLLPAISQSMALVLSARRKRRQRLAIGLGGSTILCIVAVVIYGYTVNRSQLNLSGVKVTAVKPNAELERELRQKLDSYWLTIQKSGGSKNQYSLADLGVSVDVAKEVSRAKDAQHQQSFIQKFEWWHHDSLELSPTIDQEKLETFIDNNATEIIEPPVNAALTIDGGRVTTTPTTPGQAYIAVNAKQRIVEAVRTLNLLELKLEQQAYPAKISDQVISNLKRSIEAILVQSVIVEIKGRSFTATPTDIADWIDLPDFKVAKRANIEVNSGRVLSYLDEIAAPYVQQSRSEIIMNVDGVPTVLVHGQNGIDIVDKKTLAVEIAQHVFHAAGFQGDATINEVPYETVNAASYPKWIVADISNKHMYAYEGAKLIRAFNISAGAPATPTVLGQYKIQTKVRRQDMRGQNADGSSYFQADVEWVNYFFGSYAIHGNYWRPRDWFGRVNSSHGCIGIMNDDAEWVYDWAPVGTPVITY